MKKVKEEIFEKYEKTINKGKVKLKTKQENKVYEMKKEFKVNRFTNTNRKDVKMINVDDSSKYDHSGD